MQGPLEYKSSPLRKALLFKTFRKQHFVFGQNARRESAVKKVLPKDFFDKLRKDLLQNTRITRKGGARPS